ICSLKIGLRIGHEVMLKFIVFLPFFFLVSCAPPEIEGNDLIVERTTPDPSRYLSGDYTAREGVETSFDLKTNVSTSGSSYSISKSIPGMSLNTLTGVLSGVPIYDNENLENNVHTITLTVN